MKTIHISGRRWFEKTNGNTYHSARAWIDGEPAGTIDFDYGYGDQYYWNMLLKLEREDKIPPREVDQHDRPEAWWEYEKRLGIKIAYDCADVARKKDL
jgi:hypothetical protein